MKPITFANANPIAAPKSIVRFGSARFTILTDAMARLEYANDGVFEDRASLAVINRRLSVPRFTVSTNRHTVTIRTARLVITYRETGRGFSAANLHIRFKHDGHWANWRFGQKDKGNLKGTTRTLDGAIGSEFWLWKQDEQGHWSPDRKVPIELGPGFISRDGWAVHDDTGTIVLDPSVDAMTPWAAARPAGKRQDLYFLGYGLDYKTALADAAKVFGAQPLPPRYTLGYWYSRYWAYTDREIKQMVDQFDRMQLPLDVMVIDMDWHLQGWTGYTWDHDYFPDPTALLRDLRRRGIRITLNLHPADGVGKHEAAFPAMCRDLGLDPEKTDRIPFDCTSPAFIASYFKRLHHPEEERGVDFWWMDWQQGSKTALDGLDPLPWLNHLHWIDQINRRPDRRALNFSRFGGAGSGRYPVGFSGDTHSTWESLAYQPYFTATAANVLYGTWSHDIGGHQPGPIGGELYTRWIQFGVFSPILRTHTSKNREAERRVWMYPEPYRDIMMEALQLRYRLIPYAYTEMRKAVDTGIALCRPMYYDHPRDAAAYACPAQYGFGDEMIVTPVARPVDEKTETAEVATWLPKGTWFDTATGRLEKGGRCITRHYTLDEIPVFVKAGAVIPAQGPATRTPAASYPELAVDAYPGGNGSYRCYEDDGESTDYAAGACAWIPIAQRATQTARTVTVGPAKGSFTGFQRRRALTVHFHGCGPAAKVMVNGKTVASSYDGDNAMLTVQVAKVDLAGKTEIRAVFPAGSPRIFGDGWKGLMNRLARIGYYANLVSPPHPVHPEERLAIRMWQTGNRLSRWPGKADTIIREFNRDLKRLPKALEGFQAEYRLRNDQGAADILQKARDILAGL